MKKFSIQEFANNTVTSSPSGRDYWNFYCDCGKHDLSMANVKMSEVPTIAYRLGFPDLLTAKEFYNDLSHAYLDIV